MTKLQRAARRSDPPWPVQIAIGIAYVLGGVALTAVVCFLFAAVATALGWAQLPPL